MGNEKPPQFRRLQCLGGTMVPVPLMRNLGLRRLPSGLEPIMTTVNGQPLQSATDTAVYAAFPSTIMEITSNIAQ